MGYDNAMDIPVAIIEPFGYIGVPALRTYVTKSEGYDHLRFILDTITKFQNDRFRLYNKYKYALDEIDTVNALASFLQAAGAHSGSVKYVGDSQYRVEFEADNSGSFRIARHYQIPTIESDS